MKVKSLLCALCFPLYLLGTTLVPNAPVPVSFHNSVNSSVATAGHDQTYIVVWNCVVQNLCFVVSEDNGTTWTLPNNFPFDNIPSSAPGAAANASGFVVIWIDVPPGSSPGQVQTSFSSDAGNTWSTPAALGNSANSPATITATSSGFLATWWGTDSSIYCSFSPDGLTWNTAVTIDASTNPSVQPIATGSEDSFLVTWSDVAGNGYAAFSSDQGNSWTINTITSGFFIAGVPLTPGMTQDGFIVTTQNFGGDGYYCFSSDNGTSWSSPQVVTTGISASYDAFPVIGSSIGSIVAGHFSDNTGQVSLSSTDGATWNTFVPFTGSYLMNSTLYDSFPCLAVGSQGCLVAWADVNFNAITAFIPIASVVPVEPPSSISGKNALNYFPLQKQYYNTVSWGQSPTADVVGYYVYRDGVLIADLSSLSYRDQNIQKHTTYTYTVIAYTSSGTTSTGISVQITVP